MQKKLDLSMNLRLMSMNGEVNNSEDKEKNKAR